MAPKSCLPVALKTAAVGSLSSFCRGYGTDDADRFLLHRVENLVNILVMSSLVTACAYKYRKQKDS